MWKSKPCSVSEEELGIIDKSYENYRQLALVYKKGFWNHLGPL